jgi:predicted DNA-binding protein (MmcQ/YjbR family)
MWNTVKYTNEFSERAFLDMIDHSYNEVVKGMTKKMQ